MTLRLRYTARSHTGLLRTVNEDSVYAGPRLLAVADGMGGHAAGEVASAVAISAVAPLDEDVPGADLLAMLQERVRAANATLRDMVARDPALDGMGTTLVALLFDRNRLGLLHIGDSRCYLLREGVLSQITHDHTLVQTLVDEGRLSPEEADTHPHRSVITKVLDGHDDIDPDLSVREAMRGDRYLVCSDGLTGPVGGLDTLRDALLLPDPELACDRLVQLALRGGGPDNISVVIADVLDVDQPWVEPAPLIMGAAAVAPQEPTANDSAASRAQVAEGREPQPRPVEPQPAEQHRHRAPIVLLLLALLLVSSVGAAFSYVRSQYYVGFDGDNVAVFRGVKGSVAGVPLAKVARRSTLSSDRMSTLERERVADGIIASDEPDALRIVARLITEACGPVLPTTPPTGLPTATPTARPTALPTGTRTAAPLVSSPLPSPSPSPSCP